MFTMNGTVLRRICCRLRVNRIPRHRVTGLNEPQGVTDEDFAEFVGARYESLYRLAYLLTASPTGAEDLLQTTPEKAYVNWSRIGRMEFVEAYVRRMLVNPMVSTRRRKSNGELPRDQLPDAGGNSVELAVLDRQLFWPLVCALPPRQRGDRAALLRGPVRGPDR